MKQDLVVCPRNDFTLAASGRRLAETPDFTGDCGRECRSAAKVELQTCSSDTPLVISAYKPNGGLENRFRLKAGTEDGAWDFVRTHMRQLPVFVARDESAEVIAERQGYLLFDRMVAFHVQRGVTVPLSATEFQDGLTQRFPERDGMFFLPDQVAEYDTKRLRARELVQLELFVKDEESAIQWLRQQLTKKPQTFQEIHPHFIRELGGWQKHEKMIELSEFLAQNFLCYDGKGEVPSRIHAYLSGNFKELRNLPKDDLALRAKARDRWYVPDSRKAGDLDELRTRGLLREFGRVPALHAETPEAVPPGSDSCRFPEGLAGSRLRHHHRGHPQGSGERALGGPKAADVV